MSWDKPIPDDVLEDVATRFLQRMAERSEAAAIPIALASRWVVKETPNPCLTQEEWDHHFAINDALPAYLYRRWTEMLAREKETTPCD